ncbi:SusC/RagA family TonB-linked outer membrane protein [Flavobacteriaceae bacterium F89]|jgi:iron complex outermembrane receptor protein|uniref:SusC/RagA family TonB-linked outer membrane protein n=1 Tax=Cerina litoralis TaxID=2874477 RepID=A0AAE3JQ37_9FLAO|nr:SusC/RagA family TonB-linked outer membrane protein [Cerina litoralis]MCG2462750.1 SusC/RagA family TonB-linked outer membrane protein [Cerina litoralis]
MKITFRKCLLLVGALLCIGLVKAQTVSGTVSDSNGPLPGASVLIKGTTNGAQTDFDGNYTLNNVGSDATLVVSYIGFKTQEIAVNGQTTINVTMEEDAEALSEVVVVGYGTTTKKDATGAVDAINADDITTVASANPAEALRGKVAGVQISQTNGEPGGGINIRVRGNSSVRSGNDPLIVVDGIPLAGGNISAGGSDIGLGNSAPKSALNFINQDDIESITVLKDASSTAIYGSRGANGVVIITTKGGKSGKTQFDFSTSLSISSLRGDIDMMNGDQYAERVNTLGLSEDFGSRSYDWKDAILRNAVSEDYNLGITFGNETSSNRVSFGLQNSEGIIQNTGMQRYSISFDNKSTAFDGRLTINTKMDFSQLEDQAELTSDDVGFIGNIVGVALYWNPTRALYNDDGSYNTVSNTYLNPAELLDAYDDQTSTSRILASIAPKVKITDDLDFNMVIGVDYSTSERSNSLAPNFHLQGSDPDERTNPNGDPVGGIASVSTLTRFNKTFENYFSYSKILSDDFSLKALLGYSYYDYNVESKYISARDFNVAQKNLIDNLEGGLNSQFRASSSRSRNELQSFYGRVETVIIQNLLVNASLRIDGSTRPGANEKYGTFPAVGAAYKFIDNPDGAINNVKGRLNWGITGNQEFDNNSALFVGQYENTSFVTQTNVNPNLKWETTTSYGAGVDFVFLENKLSGSLDYFYKETKDLIFPTDPAGGVPGASIKKFINLPGTLENSGVEFAFNYDAIQSEDWDFSLGGNMSYITNKMKDFDRTEFTGELSGQGLTGASSQIITNNEPLYTYFTKSWAGFDENGLSTFYRADGSITTLADAPEMLLSGKTGLPKLNIGFNTSLRYKQIDFTTSWYGQFGHYLYNNTANAYFYTSAFNGGRNMPYSYLSRGQSANDVATPSSLYLEKGDFFRLANLGLGYTFDMSGSKYINGLRVFFNGSNLLTFTGYSGFDPEVSVAVSNSNGVPSAGIDYLGYPNNKTFAFGLNLKF